MSLGNSVMPPPLLINPDTLDFEHALADIAGIRKILPQRYEMEQLTAILQMDPEKQLIVGYKDVRHDEFWVRGHMPDFPLMPGVMICEAAAQLCTYYIVTNGLLSGDFTAFGGMENVKFRDAVRPGDRLVMAAHPIEIRPGRRALFACQGIVGGNLVFHGDIIGMPFWSARSSARRPAGEQANTS
jgi:3-hydroxyacyl-[acyl-carrier-protein] dehydratase